MDPKLITPILLAALIAWAMVRRLRRSFGRQPVRAGRIWFRIVILALAGGFVLAPSVARSGHALGAVIAGMACGAALAYLGLRYTQFEATPQGRFYTPHTYIGLAVTAIFLGRLLYRVLGLAHGTPPMMTMDHDLAASYQRNPLTLGIFAALIGYYVLFYAGILIKTRVDKTAQTGLEPQSDHSMRDR